MKLQNPCTKCIPPERTETCHITCKKYKKYVFLNNIQKKNEFEEKEIDDFLAQGEGNRIKHLKRGYKPNSLKHKEHKTKGL